MQEPKVKRFIAVGDVGILPGSPGAERRAAAALTPAQLVSLASANPPAITGDWRQLMEEVHGEQILGEPLAKRIEAALVAGNARLLHADLAETFAAFVAAGGDPSFVPAPGDQGVPAVDAERQLVVDVVDAAERHAAAVDVALATSESVAAATGHVVTGAEISADGATLAVEMTEAAAPAGEGTPATDPAVDPAPAADTVVAPPAPPTPPAEPATPAVRRKTRPARAAAAPAGG